MAVTPAISVRDFLDRFPGHIEAVDLDEAFEQIIDDRQLRRVLRQEARDRAALRHALDELD